jgi:hypothetical protein
VLLKPGPAPVVGAPGRERPYHRLRLLFALEDPIEEEGAVIPADQAVIAERNRILSLPSADRPREYLTAFRRFAALDEMDLHPAADAEGEFVSLFPAVQPAPLVLADLLDLRVAGQTLQDGTVDNGVRDVHVATATIQELLCGPLFGAEANAEEGGEAPEEGPADAGGPRIDPDSVSSDGTTLDFVHAGTDLLRRSIQGDVSVFVSTYEVSAGWTRETIANIEFVANTVKISVNRSDALDAKLIRLVVKGTGSTPVLGVNRVPLAGGIGGPPGSVHQGHDFEFLLKLEE